MAMEAIDRQVEQEKQRALISLGVFDVPEPLRGWLSRIPQLAGTLLRGLIGAASTYFGAFYALSEAKASSFPHVFWLGLLAAGLLLLTVSDRGLTSLGDLSNNTMSHGWRAADSFDTGITRVRWLGYATYGAILILAACVVRPSTTQEIVFVFAAVLAFAVFAIFSLRRHIRNVLKNRRQTLKSVENQTLE